MENHAVKEMVAVTGCDSGIGYGLVDELLERGYAVLATYLRAPPHKPHADLVCWQMDLRAEGDVMRYAELVTRTTAHGQRLAALIHNAGMALAAPIEDMPMPVLREVFEVNFFGLYELTKLLVPTMIRDRSRIIVNASLAGRVGFPFFSPYVASKYAVEGFVESLRQELAPFGVRTSILDAGAIATPIWNDSWKRINEELVPVIGERWKKTFVSAAESFVAGGNAGLPVDAAVRRIVRILETKKPKPRYYVSKSPLLDRVKVLLPTRLRDRLIAGMFRLKNLTAG